MTGAPVAPRYDPGRRLANLRGSPLRLGWIVVDVVITLPPVGDVSDRALLSPVSMCVRAEPLSRPDPQRVARSAARRHYNARGRDPVATTTQHVTDEDLLRMPRDGQKYERVDGQIRVSPAGFRHGAVIARLTIRLGAFVAEHRLGHVVDSSTGFRWPGRHADRPDNVRSPDISFVAAGRLPDEREPDGFAALAPDLAVEVLSPGDRRGDVLEKDRRVPRRRHAARVGDRSGEAYRCGLSRPHGCARDRRGRHSRRRGRRARVCLPPG